ncbi:hypothetical protein EJ377_04350 [Chryseobacterium arthrosphaerae]|uniref:Uncharacterized protein n=1 Tax=Chryseobacterium arthrosphaerae TaxID=651561 RepID=A0A432DZ76_9FLAO|nr:hypothetical protein EJ377_04350 [Chryseobacterium arthrosphaerae]
MYPDWNLPQYELAKSQMKESEEWSHSLSIRKKEDAISFRKGKSIYLAESLGGGIFSESPALMTHASIPAENVLNWALPMTLYVERWY